MTIKLPPETKPLNGRNYWRSLEELADSPGFRDGIDAEIGDDLLSDAPPS